MRSVDIWPEGHRYILQKLLEMPPTNSREALVTANRLMAAKRFSTTIQKSDDTEELSTVNYVTWPEKSMTRL